uniref:Calmodulin-lysine N-methyltransferase n=1 Tax=Opuntia streptacantha TaxID=393608 RepID=A0A7C8ZZA7_OPUST
METALFSASSLFGNASDDSSDEETNPQENFVERTHQFPGMELLVREFSFHQLNANLLWPGTFAFAEWLVQHRSWVEGRCVLELGSGTGALAIFLRRLLQLDITTSDYDDQEIKDNIAYNCKINRIIPPLPHVKHTWGDAFPIASPNWDLVIASDILLCLPYPAFLMSWRRRIGKDDESLFFKGCEDAGLLVRHLGSRVYCISLRD